MPTTPLELFLFAITSMVSTWLLFGAFKAKDVPRILMGIGFAIPSFGIGSFNVWLVAAAVCGASIWLRRYMDGV